MSERTAPVLRWAILAVFIALAIAVLAVQAAGRRPVIDIVTAAGGFAIYAAPGALIVLRRDGHLTGWLLILIGMAVHIVDGIAYLPGISEIWERWVASWGWTLVFTLFAALTLTFPSGRLPEGRGRWARTGRIVAYALPLLLFVNATTISLGGPEAADPTPSPVGIFPTWTGDIALLSVVGIMLAGSISLLVRRRRMTGADRAQLTWVVFAFTLLVVAVALTFAYIFTTIGMDGEDPGDSAWGPVYVLMLLFPLAFAVAVMRYRLYEIDRIISRTASYALLAGLLAAVFFGVVTLLTTLLPAQSDLAVAGSTLAVAALFNPFRIRLHALVDRRFNRSRYDTQRVMDGFAGSLRDELDTGRMVSGWIDVVSATMQPHGAGIWIKNARFEPSDALAPSGAEGAG